MHITALCPHCRSAYQVEATLRGKLVHCPNPACKKIFPVPEDVPPPELPAAVPQPRPRPSAVIAQRSGTVGDLVPILPAEQAAAPAVAGGTSKHVSEMVPVAPGAPAAGQPADGDWWQGSPPVRDPSAPQPPRSPAAPPSPAPASGEAWWQNAPPPVRNPQKPAEPQAATAPAQRPRSPGRPTGETQPIRLPVRPTAETQPMRPLPPQQGNQPRELPPGVWEPPPVRRGSAGNEQDSQRQEERAASEAHQPPVSKRRARRIAVGLVVSAIILLLCGIGYATWIVRHSEERQSKEALTLYTDGLFKRAAEKYSFLAQKFSDSEKAKEYTFMAEWSSVSDDANKIDGDPLNAIDRLNQFVNEHKTKDLMVQHAHDAGQRLLKVTKTLVARNATPLDEKPLKSCERIEQLQRMVAELDSAALTKEDSAQIEADLRQVRKAVEMARKRREVLAQLRKRDRETWMDAIKRSRALVASMERELPGIRQEAQPASDQLYQGHLDSVKYHPRNPLADDVLPPPRFVEEDAKTLLFAPLLGTAAPGKAPDNDPIVLALSRGILYGLKQYNGELKWAIRVGIDTTVLPHRVPASAFNPQELLLVMSADTQTLSALGVEGDREALWEYHVGQPVLGRPVIIGNRAYLADYAGWVHEIELSRGQLLGRWTLGQRLTRGGAREPGTTRIYFPADDSCIYVVDVNPDPEKRRCVLILYDDHPSGSLRSEPIIIPPVGDNAPGYLILNQSSGLDRMQLKVFELPLQDRHASPKLLDPPARLPGWSWFEPKEDGERLSVLSDAGNLGVFGIHQLNNQDQPLFPWLEPGGLDLSPFLPGRPTLARERGRSQVVYMRGDDLWVLARGQLQHLRLCLDDMVGPKAKPRWKAPLPLGSPLHEPQRFDDRETGLSTFILATQDLETQTCLATKVDERGKIQWQRQLGLVCRGEPLALTPPDGGPQVLLALDQGGGLFVLDPLQPSKHRYLGSAFSENLLVPPRLLLAPDGQSAYEIAGPGDGRNQLLVRHIGWNGGRELDIQAQHEVPLLSLAETSVMTPAGPPIVLGSQLLIPFTDGKIWYKSLEAGNLESGPDWRAPGASVTASCSLLALGGNRLLAIDGSRGLRVWEWQGNQSQGLPREEKKEDKDFTPQFDHLVASPPVLVPAADGSQPGVAVADSSGKLHLFIVQPDGSLKPKMAWSLDGNLTAGPFLQAEPKGSGWRIGCVLDRQRLLWIDPAKANPLWTYSTNGPAILGHPRRIEDMLVVTLQSGRYVGLGPLSGKPTGHGYALRTSAAPAATPMPFGQGILFTPLSDGTALRLPLERLREQAKK